jgi:flagellar motor switch protein FliM
LSDILSQSEIDELLRSLTSGGSVAPAPEPRHEAKSYDFARPSKFNKEHLRSIHIMFDNYARMISSFLTGYLRVTVSVEAANAEQASYQEFQNTLVNPVALAMIDLAPFSGTCVMELSTEIGYVMIDRILGGQGLSLKKTRDFSDLEKILLERVLTQMLSFIPEAWESVAKVEPRITKLETNSQFAQIIAPHEMTALVTLSVSIGETTGWINFCLPYIVIEPVIDRLNTRIWFGRASSGGDGAFAPGISDSLEKTGVQLTAVVGGGAITVADFLSLAPGDIIPLGRRANDDLDIFVGDIRKFKAKPGIFKGRNAVAITSVIVKDD